MKKGIQMDGILKKMEQLAGGKANDAVKLAFLDSERVDTIDGLDLTALAEFKRSGNGTVEIRLVDRVMVLEKLAGLVDGGENKAEAFFRALEGETDEAGQEGGETSGVQGVFRQAAEGTAVVV